MTWPNGEKKGNLVVVKNWWMRWFRNLVAGRPLCLSIFICFVVSKHSSVSDAALAGLASKENYSSVSLRSISVSEQVTNNSAAPYKSLMLMHVKGQTGTQLFWKTFNVLLLCNALVYCILIDDISGISKVRNDCICAVQTFIYFIRSPTCPDKTSGAQGLFFEQWWLFSAGYAWALLRLDRRICKCHRESKGTA